MRAQPLPFVGGFYADDSRPFSMQDICNYLPSMAEQQGTRSPLMAKTPPGLSPFARISGDPVRGVYSAEDRLFTVMGNTLYQVNPTAPVVIGAVSGVSRVKFAHNQVTGGNELLVVNGSGGSIYNTATQVFQNITDEGYPGAVDALYMDGYFVQIEPARRYAFNSDLANGLAYNTLDRFTSEKSPDLLMALGSSQNDLILFSESTGEFFENTGASQQPFRSKRISMERGCASRYGVVHLDNTVFWLGNDGKFYVLDGYGSKRISTRPIEQAILGLNWAQAFGFVWESAGHSCAYWTFPDGQTWGYDVSQPAGFQWHRRESYGFDRWRITGSAYWRKRWIAGDFQAGRLWELDWDYPLEYETEMVGEITGPVIHDNQSAVQMPRLEFVFDTGQQEVAVREFEIDVEALDIDGDLPDSFVGDAGTYQYTVTGGVPPYAGVSIFSGSLPPGSTMDSAGLVTYDYTTVGSYSWVVQVEDAEGNTATVADTAEISSIACGAESSYAGGEAFPTEFDVLLGSDTGTVTLRMTFGPVPDKCEIWFDGVKVIDTAYRGDVSQQANLDAALALRGLPSETIIQRIGTQADAELDWAAGEWNEFTFNKVSSEATATVKVYGPYNTIWKLALSCPGGF